MGWDSVVGVATCYGLGSPGIEPVTVAERSKACVCSRSPAGIAGSNPSGGMDVCVVQWGQKAKPGQWGQSSTDKVQRESKKNPFRSQWPCGLRRLSAAGHLLGLRVRIPSGAWMFALCVVKTKGKMQDNQDKRHKNGWSAEYRRIQKENPGWWRGGGATFSTPVQTGPGAHLASYTIGIGSLSRG